MPTLTTTTASIEVATRGAELTSFVCFATGLEYVWQADPAYWGRHAPLLFPIVGRLPDDTYLHNGQAYKLPQHGFARDQEFQILEQTSSTLTLQLLPTAASRAMYPFEFDLRVHYRLHPFPDTLQVRWEVHNPADTSQDLLFSIGAHPAFRCPLRPEQGEQFTDYALYFERPPTLERQWLAGGLRTGQTAPVPTLGRRLPLSYDLFADDALVFAHPRFSFLKLRAASGDGPFVTMQFDDFPYLGIWTKPGAGFVCIEPWQGVASPAGPVQELRDKEGIIALPPGQVFTAGYYIGIDFGGHPEWY